MLFYYVLGEKVLRAEAPHSIMKDLSAAYRYEQEGPVTVIQPMRVIERELPKAVKVDPTKIDELLNKNSVEEYTKTDATTELKVDDQIAMTIEAWNSNKNIRATIDRIPFGTKRYDHMMLTIAQFGWEKFIEEIRSLDSNKFFEEWQPGFDWIADPNNFMKLCEGNYRSGKQKEVVDKYSKEYWDSL